jgi:hypothetical protein
VARRVLVCSGMPLACNVLADPARLAALRPEWEDLLARSASNRPALSPSWMLAWWRVFGPRDGRRLRAVALRDGGRLVGLALLLLRRHWYLPGIPFRRLEMLGTGEGVRDEVCSDYLDVIAERGAEEAVAAALVEALVGGGAGEWDELVLDAMDGTSALPSLLADALARRGVPARVEETASTLLVELPPTWDAYLGRLSASGRYFVLRSLRDFEAWAQGGTTIVEARTAAELERGKRLLEELHGERWDGEGAFASPLFGAFHDRLMPELFARGSLSLSWLAVRGEPVAASYNLRWSGREYFYQCGRKVDLPKGVRPGIVLHAHAIRRAIEAGLVEYDFLRGDQQYKRKLATARRPLVAVRAVRPSLRERARSIAERGLAHARTARRSLRGARAEGGERP